MVVFCMHSVLGSVCFCAVLYHFFLIPSEEWENTAENILN